MTNDFMNDGRVGREVHQTPAFCADNEINRSMGTAGTTLGIAYSMLEEFKNYCISKGNVDQTAALLRLAKASAEVDSAHALLITNARNFSYRHAGEVTEVERQKVRLGWCYSGQVCRHAAATLFEASGSASVYTKKEVSRLWRNINTSASHGALAWDATALAYGNSLMDQSRRTEGTNKKKEGGLSTALFDVRT